MEHKKKIAVIISSLHKGGAERMVSELTLHWPKDWEIDLIINNKNEIEYPYRGNIIDLGMKIQKNKLKVLYQFKVFFVRIIAIKKLKKKNDYIACISVMDSANIANIVSGNKFCKVIATVRTDLKGVDLPQYKYIVNPLARCLYKKVDKIVGVSEEISDDLINYFKVNKEKVVTINNGFDIRKIRNLTEEELDHEEKEWFKDSDNILVTLGRLDYMKAQWHMIRAMKKVKETYKDAKLLVIGDGNLKESLMILIKELRLENSVILCGIKDNPFKIVSKCKAFVLSSIHEGFPNVLPEAMCCGIPCIATDFKTGVREILDPYRKITKKVDKVTLADYGIISPVCDGKMRGAVLDLTYEENCLAEAICLMLRDSGLRKEYHLAGLERSKDLSIDESIKKYVDLVNSN